jgi:hypothetical protein
LNTLQKTLRAIRVDGHDTTEEFVVEIVRTPQPAVVMLQNHAFGTVRFEEVDAFAAMVEIRRFLEARGLLLLCGGARFDAYPSGMGRQMSGGMKLYLHERGVHGVRPGFVGLLDDAPRDRVGTIAQQNEYMDRWRNE